MTSHNSLEHSKVCKLLFHNVSSGQDPPAQTRGLIGLSRNSLPLARLAAAESRAYFVYPAFFPAIAFWVLDGYFLWQEPLFRALYDHVRKLKEENVDFSMDTSIVKNKVQSWFAVVFSTTLWIFHGTVILAIIVVTLLLRSHN